MKWFETVANTEKRHKSKDAREKFIEFANQRAAAARAVVLFDMFEIRDDALKAKMCDTALHAKRYHTESMIGNTTNQR